MQGSSFYGKKCIECISECSASLLTSNIGLTYYYIKEILFDRYFWGTGRRLVLTCQILFAHSSDISRWYTTNKNVNNKINSLLLGIIFINFVKFKILGLFLFLFLRWLFSFFGFSYYGLAHINSIENAMILYWLLN